MFKPDLQLDRFTSPVYAEYFQYRRNFDVLQMQLILNHFFCGYR